MIEGYREKCGAKTVLGARFAKKPDRARHSDLYITGMSSSAPWSLEAKMAAVLAKGRLDGRYGDVLRERAG